MDKTIYTIYALDKTGKVSVTHSEPTLEEALLWCWSWGPELIERIEQGDDCIYVLNNATVFRSE